MKKRIIALMLAAVVTVAAMTSCTISVKKNGSDDEVSSNDYDYNYDSDDDYVSSLTSSEPKADPTADYSVFDGVEIPTDLYSSQIGIDGKFYTLPCSLSDFEADGWVFESDEGTLKSGQYTIGTGLDKGDKHISVTFVNMTDNELDYKDCKIGSVSVYMRSKVAVMLPGGFKLDENITADTVKELYGEPYKEDTNDYYTTLRYKKGSGMYNDVLFYIYHTDSTLRDSTYVSVTNYGI